MASTSIDSILWLLLTTCRRSLQFELKPFSLLAQHVPGEKESEPGQSRCKSTCQKTDQKNPPSVEGDVKEKLLLNVMVDADQEQDEVAQEDLEEEDPEQQQPEQQQPEQQQREDTREHSPTKKQRGLGWNQT